MQNAIKGRQPCQCSCTEMRVAQVCKHQVLQKCASAFLVWSFVLIYRSFKSHFSEAKTTSAYGECFEVFRTHFWAAWTCVRFVFPFKQRSHSLDVNWRSQSGYILLFFLLNSLLGFAKIFVALQQQYRCILKIFSENDLPIATLIKTLRNYLIWLAMDSPV